MDEAAALAALLFLRDTRPRVPFYRLIEHRRARRSVILSKRWQ